MMTDAATSSLTGIAIVGMAGRFPGASSTDALWQNLVNQQHGIRFFRDSELREVEHDFEVIKNHPQYVKARGVLENIDQFDASFFGFSPREAAALDPQQRLWFECAWESLEDAGYDPQRFQGLIGVFAGSGYLNTYLLHNLCRDRKYIEDLLRLRGVNAFQAIICNDKDFLPTRTSYLLDLRGPSINVQTACSTSLVAVAQACQSLVTYESDMCLAGGVSIQLPQDRGYMAQHGGMDSPDGFCRVFDARAGGTVFSNGVGAVVLRRLEDARADGDHIYGVIKGWAVNNDGGRKQSYVAPSQTCQAEVIAAAQAVAGFEPESISYIEAHGTATQLGDPIEVAALTQAFRRQTDERQFCGIGSIKSSIGHLDSAAGVAGLIKTALALKYKQLPATLHFQQPNPEIDFANSPFYVVDKTQSWETRDGRPRRAGVSSFGVGGTNVHVVLEESPEYQEPPASPSPVQLLCLSAKSPAALEQRQRDLREHLERHTSADLADVSYSLQVGRQPMTHRQFWVCADVGDAVRQLGSTKSPRAPVAGREPRLVFMFPGQGSQYPGMGHGLYQSEPAFRRTMDHCLEILHSETNCDFASILYPERTDDQADERLRATQFAQPALFAVEYSLSQLLLEWGLKPTAMIGHSVGEYVAACLAGVLTADQALRLLVIRGRLIHSLPPGQMMAVPMSASALERFLEQEVTIAACNAPELTVVSGTVEAIARLSARLATDNIRGIVLHTSHAFHSPMMAPVESPFADAVRGFELREPCKPFISSLTGDWITGQQATDPEYWARQLLNPVRFCQGMARLSAQPGSLFLEVGPGAALSSLAKRQVDVSRSPVVSTMPRAHDTRSDAYTLLSALGELWCHGYPIDKAGSSERQNRRKTPLPTYPFQRKPYWISPPALEAIAVGPTIEPKHPMMETRTEQQVPMMHTPQPPAPPQPPRMSRKTHLLSELTHIVEDLTGMAIDEPEAGLTFTEMGMDSLFLTQLSIALQNKFGRTIKLRQLLEDVNTLEAVAVYYDEQLPAGECMPPEPESEVVEQPAVELPASPAIADVAAARVSVPAAAAAPAIGRTEVHDLPAGAGVERLFQDQIALMSRQLEYLARASQGVNPVTIDSSATVPGATSSPGADMGHRDRQLSPPPPSVPAADDADRQAADQEASAAKKKPFGAGARIDTTTSLALDDAQQSCLNAFIQRYTARTKTSKDFTQKHRAGMSDPRAVSGFSPLWKEMVYPIVVDKSRGSKLWDLDGNEYVDLTCGFGSNFLGYSPPFIVDAIAAQLDSGFEVGPQHPLAGEVAEMITQLTGMERVAFCNTGSEAVMGAMRQARTVTGKNTIVIFANSYHGIFNEVIVRPGHKLRSVPAAPGIPPSFVENVLVLEYGSDASLEIIRERIDELAAVMVEPVQSRQPHLQPREFLHALREITAQAGVALIFDEVITGFRIRPGGAQEYFGIRADIATYGKIIGGGLPFAAIAGIPRFMDALDGGHWQFGDDSYPEAGVTYFAGTFVRHPLALAAAKASIQHLIQEGPALQQRLNDRTERFVRELNNYFQSVQAPVEITYFGSLCRIRVDENLPFGSLLYYWLRDKGVHVWEGFGCFLTTAHDDNDVALVVDAFKRSVAELQVAGLFPGRPRREFLSSAPQVMPAADQAPLTEPQREVWFASQIGNIATSSYNESFEVHLDGPLQVETLRASLAEFTGRHDALNVRIDTRGEFQQRVPAWTPEVPLVDLSDASLDKQQQEIQRMHQAESENGFDLANGPLIRFTLLKLASDKHILVTTAHHIVFDGWSGGVFVEELGAIYSARVQGQSPSLEPAPRFLNYAIGQSKSYQTPEYQASLAYWRSLFADGGPVLELTGDRPRPSIKSYRGSTVRWTFPTELLRDLKPVAARLNTTLFGLLLSAFNVLLHRLSNQNDLVVGIPAAGQSVSGQEWLVGHCVNIIPVRTNVEGNAPFDEYTRQVKAALLDGQEHQQCTLGAILHELSLQRDPSRSPLVEVLFNLNRELPRCEMQGIATRVEELPKSATHWDLFLDMDATDQEFSAECDFNTDIFDAETIERWMGYYQVLLQELARDTSRPIQQLPLLSANDRDTILFDWNATQSEFPDQLCVPELVQRQAAKAPDAVAVLDAGSTLSYQQLVDKSIRIACYLRSLGVARGDRVGVFMERSSELVCVLLGIMQTGAAYVPLDVAFPTQRNQDRAKDAGLKLVVTDAKSRPDAAGDWRLVIVDDCPATVDPPAPDQPATPPLDSSDTAYVLYTSGSSGQPKGVEVSHRALTNFLWSMKTTPGITQRDVVPSITTLSFDIAGLEIYLPLISGARVVIFDAATVTDASQLARAIDDHQITLMQATPATWQALLNSGWTGRSQLRMLCGGEALLPELARELAPRGAELWNMYGPTETTIWSSVDRIAPDDTRVTIGRPIANTQLYVLDQGFNPQPIGVSGMLFIAGEGLAKGYIGRSDLTAERFVPCPFLPGTQMYNTGDVARFLPDGRIECLGREDSQVKLRGFRIELGEIESILTRHDEVRHCTAVVREIAGEKTLIAYVLTDGDQRPSTSDLRRFAQEYLPEYMIPSHFVALTELPLLPSGKVNRDALPLPDAERPQLAEPFRSPRSDVEEVVARVWQDVLRIESIGIDDNFFELGGHSVLVMQVVAQLREVFHAEIPVGIHFEAPTIRRLCERLHNLGYLPAEVARRGDTTGEREEFEI